MNIKTFVKTINKKVLGLLAVLIPLLLLFFYVALRSGPLAPVPVTVATVERKAISPSLSGIGTVEARYTYRIGSVAAGRVKRITVDVGDMVKAGDVVGEIDPVDLEEHLAAQRSAIKRSEAAVLSAEAQLRDAKAKQVFSASQEKRYAAPSCSNSTMYQPKSQLRITRAVSTERAALCCNSRWVSLKRESNCW